MVDADDVSWAYRFKRARLELAPATANFVRERRRSMPGNQETPRRFEVTTLDWRDPRL